MKRLFKSLKYIVLALFCFCISGCKKEIYDLNYNNVIYATYQRCSFMSPDACLNIYQVDSVNLKPGDFIGLLLTLNKAIYENNDKRNIDKINISIRGVKVFKIYKKSINALNYNMSPKDLDSYFADNIIDYNSGLPIYYNQKIFNSKHDFLIYYFKILKSQPPTS